MKKLFLLSTLFLLAIQMFAQLTSNSIVKGKILNDLSSKGIAGHIVYLRVAEVTSQPIDSGYKLFVYENKTVTDSNGYYQFVVNIPMALKINITVKTLDCNAKTVEKTVGISNNSQIYEINLTICDQVINPPACKAGFSFVKGIDYTVFPGINRIKTPLTYTFINQSAGNNLTYFWDFNDSTTAKDKNVIHDFKKEGLFHVCLTVSDGLSCKNQFCRDVQVKKSDSVIPQPSCKANYTYTKGIDRNIFPNIMRPETARTYTFISKSMGNPLLNCICLTYLWDFGDGTSAKDMNVIHDFKHDTIYNVCLTIYDSTNKCSDKICQLIKVVAGDSTIVCKADFNFNRLINSWDSLSMRPSALTNTFQLTNTSSGNILKTFWDFGDGSYSYDKNPIHTFMKNAVYKVCLTVGGISCYNTYCKEVVVGTNDSLPVVPCKPDFYIQNFVINSDSSVTFDKNTLKNTFQFIDNSTGNITNRYWNFNDGSIVSSDLNPVHTFAGTSNAYKVCLTITGLNCKEIMCQPVYTSNTDSINQTCHSAFYIDPIGISKDSMMKPLLNVDPAHTFSFTNVSTGNIEKVYWDFGDGLISQDKNPIHTFGLPAVYQVCLTVYGTNCKDYSCQKVFISSNDSVHVDPLTPDTIYNKTIMAPESKILDHLILVIDSCIIDYQKIIESVSVKDFVITGDKIAEIHWLIKQNGIEFIINKMIHFNMYGLNRIYLTINCNDGKKKTIHTNTFVDQIDLQPLAVRSTLTGKMEFTIHPNPVSENLNIDLYLANKEKVQIILLNQFGQVVNTFENVENAGLNRVNLDASTLSNGLYFVQVKGEQNKFITKKFVKVN